MTELATLGVEVIHIQMAYRSVREMQTVRLTQFGGQRDLEEVISAVINNCQHLGLMTRVVSSSTMMGSGHSSQARFAITGNLSSAEDVMTCQVIQRLLQHQTQEIIDVFNGQNHTEVMKCNKMTSLIVLLSQGILANITFAVILMHATAAPDHELVPVLSETNFVFPDHAFWTQLDSGKVLDPGDDRLIDVGLNAVKLAYKALFNIPSLRFSAWGSESIQRVEIRHIAHRILRKKTNRKPGEMLNGAEREMQRGTKRQISSDHPITVHL